MERLTKESEIFGDITFRGDGCTLDQVKQRLFDYEEAEEQLIKAAGVDLQSMVGEFMHYYTLQKEGRLVELPCKVGDTVYRINKGARYPIIALVVTEIRQKALQSGKVIIKIICSDDVAIKTNGCLVYYPEEIGMKIFLTREEAEAALERMK